MTPDDVRKSFLEAMSASGSRPIPAAGIIPENDATTLFIGSGMQPMIPYLLGESHPSGNDVVNVQPCVRTGDIDEVGDISHLTFFEMTGRWELGADPATYKRRQIERIARWKFDILGMDPARLYVSTFAGNDGLGIEPDAEAIETWKGVFARYGVEATVETEPFRYGASRGARIFVYDENENWWSRAGVPSNMPVGEPGGPDSEMFFDFDPDGDELAHPAAGGERFVEIGNNVFMSHERGADAFRPFDKPNIDYGGGLERIYAAVLGQPDLFLTPFFATPLARLAELSGHEYADATADFRIVLDHARAASFLIGSGAPPSNTDAGYVTRRLLRRAARVGRKLGIESAFLSDLAAIFVAESATYDFMRDKAADIVDAVAKEESSFGRTLKQGEREIRKHMASRDVTGTDAFYFYETFGFPLELTREVLHEASLELIDPDSYAVAAEKHSALSKSASAGKFAGGLADHSVKNTASHTAAHLMLAGLRKVLGDHVHQMGSNITPERIRFDFSHGAKVTREELDEVERFVNEGIASDAAVTVREMPKAQAREQGIEGSFWDKYPETVKVYRMEDAGEMLWSEELCGGPHVERTSLISEFGGFRITKESSVSAGARRVKAVLEK